ncbi:unnamed protein product [Mesocestoides corti]|uniref:Retrotrans_gag domain-containing protein n=1 Tax=Mesocestoides corti TaxID=53468 RepID=A0A0R3U5M4_MESCO|nr:unnamed protein product [Mesocestoides corti]
MYELDEDFDAWLVNIQDALSAVEPDRRLACIMRFLSKEAALRAHRAGCTPKMPYENLEQTLRDNFVSHSDRSRRLWELDQRKLRYGETVKCYVDELYNMVSNVHWASPRRRLLNLSYWASPQMRSDFMGTSSTAPWRWSKKPFPRTQI